MIQLSIIIVNYNVRHFLEHCLLSVERACTNIPAEVFVVDNQSTDGSQEMVRSKFPNVQLIANEGNLGFAKANNQAFKKAKGRYVLYLNPDTIVAEDCFEKCLKFMIVHDDVGALGPRLIDGKGNFLPESKRGFPSAWVAFCRISGLSSLFKNSKRFNQYHLGYIDEDTTSEVDVLAGCFMFCRKSVLDEVGSFDEQYFMYGEDIDLSYQIKKAGYSNVYFPETSVIHYKGESTKKGSMNYVRMFYNAMILFAKKNFENNQGLFVALISLAIYFRGFIAFLNRIFTKISLVLLDLILLLGSLGGTLWLWKEKVKPQTEYSDNLLLIFFGTYVTIWILSLFFSGAYDKPYRAPKVLRGMLIGSVAILSIYALLSEDYRFSRGITILGALFGTLLILFSRKVLAALGVQSAFGNRDLEENIIIVGDEYEEAEIKNLMSQAGIQKDILGSVSPFEHKAQTQLAVYDQLKPIAKVYQATEIIFSQQHLRFKDIILSMGSLGNQLDYKIHSFGTDSIIGSNSKNTAGDLYTRDLSYAINAQSARRNKRLVDVLVSSIMILLLPIIIFMAKNRDTFLDNLFKIFVGDKTFVGYTDPQFPKIKPPALPVYITPKGFKMPADNIEHLNWLYAKKYSPWHDLKIISENWLEI